MNSTEILQKKQWYEDPGLFGFAMQAKEFTGKREDIASDLKQQKYLAEAQLGFKKDKAAVANKMQGHQINVGMWQAQSTAEEGLSKYESENPEVTYTEEQILALPADKQVLARRKQKYYSNLKSNIIGISNYRTQMQEAINSLLGIPNKPTIVPAATSKPVVVPEVNWEDPSKSFYWHGLYNNE